MLGVSLFSGCVAPSVKNVKSKPPEYKLDLDNNGIKEIISIEDKFDLEGNALITISKQKNKKVRETITSFSVPGRTPRIELIDLSEDGYKQIAVYYETKNNYANLVIYNLKNDKLTKIFNVSSSCGIDTDFTSVLAKIKAGKPKKGQSSCFSLSDSDWDVWVWGGEKFIKER